MSNPIRRKMVKVDVVYDEKFWALQQSFYEYEQQEQRRMNEIMDKWSETLKALSESETLCDWNGCPHCRNRR